jgi:PAS domain S-box-containing protein
VNVRSKLRLMTVVAVAGLAVFAALTFTSLSEVAVRGPIYESIKLSRDVVTEYVPPSQTLLRIALLTATVADSAGDDEHNHLARLHDAMNTLEEHHPRYLGRMPDGELKDLMNGVAYTTAVDYIRIVREEFLPLVQAGRMKEAHAIHTNRLHPIYQAHAAAVGRVVEQARQQAKRDEAAGEAKARAYSQILAGVGGLMLLSVGGLSFALGRGISRQTDELARSERLRGEQARLLRSVVESMADGLVVASPEGKLLIWNPAADRLVGTAHSDIAPERWAEHYGLHLPDGSALYPAERLPLARAVAGEECEAEVLVRPPSRTQGVFLEVSARPLRDDSGRPAGGLCVLRDVTRRKEDERHIRQLNDDLERKVADRTAELNAANEQLEAFSYSVSHDLRAPLRHIAGFSKILVEEYGPRLDSQARHCLERIEGGVQKMDLMVTGLLEIARVGRRALRRRPTNLNDLIPAVLTVLRPETEGRAVEWRIAPLPTADCDPTLIEQVFQNLISNALKYSRPRQAAVVEVGEENGAIFVRDNGVGFDMKYAGHLFGAFRRLHGEAEFEGTGIGLATVRRIVEKHGGRVWAESEPGQGATFYFTLPPADAHG